MAEALLGSLGMGILTRYLIRSHIGPFLFALGALTGLLFLNAVAQRMGALVGKGLGWRVIGEFLLLSLPHTIALTLPMAVLIAVLYAFTELASSSEITAMSAGGIRPTQLMIPITIVGFILAGVTFYFNDRILPEANHRLRNLIVDIGNKSPTFQLREQVVNEIETGDRRTRYYLQAARIDQATNELTDVTIFDLSDPARQRTIHASHGTMAFNEAKTDLFLTLEDGIVYETDGERVGELQRTRFETQILPMRGIADDFQREAGGGTRSDREMSVGMLSAEARDQVEQLRQVRAESLERSLFAVRRTLGLTMDSLPPVAGSVAVTRPEPPLNRFASAPASAIQQDQARVFLRNDDLTASVALAMRTNATREEIISKRIDEFSVEIHKKFSIAAACIIFVLLGGPLAVRFPRGGVGMVISVSVGIFGVYWMGLIGGENLADRGAVPPALAMWAANLIFLLAGILLLLRMDNTASTNRGGGGGPFKRMYTWWATRRLLQDEGASA